MNPEYVQLAQAEVWKQRIGRQIAALEARPIEERLAETEALLISAWGRNEELEYAANPTGADQEYVKLGDLAKATVIAVMTANEAKHPDAKWKTQLVGEHLQHAEFHIDGAIWAVADPVAADDFVEDAQNALTRCAMALQVYQAGARTDVDFCVCAMPRPDKDLCTKCGKPLEPPVQAGAGQ